MILINLDDQSRMPMYQQILDQIRQKIEAGTLKTGDKLPSTRRLAEKLDIHRSTVATAYQELWSLGFIELNPGARPRVRSRMKIATPADHDKSGSIDWQVTASSASSEILNTYQEFQTQPDKESNEPMINFSSLDMDSRLFSIEHFRSSMNRAIKDYGIQLLGYGEHKGYLPLRQYITRRLQMHGVSVTPEEVLLTSGSQQAIDLVLRMIAAPRKSVAVESPSYNYMLPLLRFSGLKPSEIPIRQDGMDLEILAERIANDPPSLVYTMPNFHNPTGITTSQSHREKLLSMCQKSGIPILEDGFEEEMKYFGKEVLPIKSMDTHHVVIYCGTFSKVLFPGVRIGWIAAGHECIQRLTAIRRFSELSPSMVLQAAMYQFCHYGYYDRHISKMHRIFRKRMLTAIGALNKYISNDWAEWQEPNGGFLIWLKLKPLSNISLTPQEWKNFFISHGLQVGYGNYYFSSQVPDTYLRLSISTLDENEIEEGILRLSKTFSTSGLFPPG
jgi:DNA-binding transcriptional MocR family regulator